MRKYLLGVALASAVAVVVPTAATAAPVRDSGARVSAGMHGWARLDLGPVPNPDQLLTLSLDAHAVSRPADRGPLPTKSWGHATIQHVFMTDGVWTGTTRVEADIDCLTEVGGTTVVTGTAASIVWTSAPGQDQVPLPPSSWHPEVAFSFHDDGEGNRRVGWSGIPRGVNAPPVAARCQVPVSERPDLYLVQGGFTLKR